MCSVYANKSNTRPINIRAGKSIPHDTKLNHILETFHALALPTKEPNLSPLEASKACLALDFSRDVNSFPHWEWLNISFERQCPGLVDDRKERGGAQLPFSIY
jgi:hypothetical protein